MMELSYRRHRFPPVVIQRAVWLYLRFTLSYRDVEELLAERGLDISYETVRCWVLKFGPVIARRLRRRRPRLGKVPYLVSVALVAVTIIVPFSVVSITLLGAAKEFAASSARRDGIGG